MYYVTYHCIIINWILDLMQFCCAPTQKVRREAAAANVATNNTTQTSIVSSLTSPFPSWHPIITRYTHKPPNIAHTATIFISYETKSWLWKLMHDPKLHCSVFDLITVFFYFNKNLVYFPPSFPLQTVNHRVKICCKITLRARNKKFKGHLHT